MGEIVHIRQAKKRKRPDQTKAAMHYLQAVESGEIPEIMDEIVKSRLTPGEDLALEYAREFGQS